MLQWRQYAPVKIKVAGGKPTSCCKQIKSVFVLGKDLGAICRLKFPLWVVISNGLTAVAI